MSFDLKEYERWLSQADQTLKSAYMDRREGFHNWSCFKAHQSAEYVIKGLLYGLGVLAVGHSISKLLSELSGRGLETSEGLLQAGRRLDLHYIPTRYPNAYSEGSPHEYYDSSSSEIALRDAEAIISFVKNSAERRS